MSSRKFFLALCALPLGALSVSVDAQSGQAQANYEIGSGAAAALQVYRYESAHLDLTRDANAVVFGEAAKTNPIAGRIDLNDAACDFGVAQIDTDIKIINKIAKRPGATKDDIRRKEKAETALHDFIALVGTTPTALQSPLQRAVRNIAGDVTQEEFAAMFLVASDKKPAIIELPAPASTARERYDNMVKLSHDGFGAAADDNFAKAGTTADDSDMMANRADAPHRVTLLKQLAEAANAIVNKLIEGENHQNASVPSPTGPGQDTKGPAQARYEEAIAQLNVIGPGAAAAMQTYRYESAPMDLTRDDNERNGVAQTKNNNAFSANEVTLNIVATQIATEMTDLRKMGSRPGATKAEVQRKEDGEKAFRKFLSLGGDSGNGDDDVTKVQKTLKRVVEDANIELGASMVRAASNQNPGNIDTPPSAASAKEQYDNMVKLLNDGLGAGAASALQAVRYAREQADSFKDASGNALYPQDEKAIHDKRVPLDAPLPGIIRNDGTPMPNGFLMSYFGAQTFLDAVNLNDASTSGLQKRQLNARHAVKAFVAAGGGDPAAADDNFRNSGTASMDATNDSFSANKARLSLAAQMNAAADRIIDKLIREEHSIHGAS
jgi:hypothetical protein